MNRGARILVVEDERLILTGLTRQLTNLGYEVVGSAVRGPDAVELAARTTPDLVLMDVHLEGDMTGLEAAALIKQHGTGEIIFLTACSDDEALVAAAHSDAAAYLLKPADEPALRCAIELGLNRGRLARALRERELETRKLLARLATIVDHLSVGILVEDEARIVQHVNSAFCRMFNVEGDPASLLGQSGAALLRSSCSAFEAPERYVSQSERLMAAGEAVENEVLRLVDGRAFERDYRPIMLEGAVTGHVWTYRDVTRRERDRAQLLNKAARLESASVTDELTGLCNRRGFRIEGEKLLGEARRTQQNAIVAFVDIDGLKTINDQHGHALGDQAIRAAADVLRGAFPAPDLVARLGGDEFAVLKITTEPLSAHSVQDQVYGATHRFNHGEQPFELRMSVGAAVSDPRQAELGMLMAAADAAMYVQKQDRRNSRPPAEVASSRSA